MEEYTRQIISAWIKTIHAPFTTDEVVEQVKRRHGKNMVEDMLSKRGLVAISLGNDVYVTDTPKNIVEKYGQTHCISHYNPKNGSTFYIPLTEERLFQSRIAIYLVESKPSEIKPIRYTLDDDKEYKTCTYEEFLEKFGNGEFGFKDIDNRQANHSWVMYHPIYKESILYNLFMNDFRLKVVSKKFNDECVIHTHNNS